jgi:hypothetical protein
LGVEQRHVGRRHRALPVGVEAAAIASCRGPWMNACAVAGLEP